MRVDPRGTLALLGVVICWGSMPVFLRALTAHVDAWTANGLRYPLAALLYWPVLLHACRRGTLDRRLLARAIVPSAFSLVGQIFWALAPYFIPAALVGFLVKTSIVWALVGAMVLFPDERPLLGSSRFWAGLVLAFAGVVALSLARGALETGVTGDGVLIILACSVFFGLYGVSVRYFLRGIHPFLAFGVVVQYTSAGTLTLMLLFGAPAVVLDLSPEGWTLIVVSALLGIAISHSLYYISIHRLGAALSNMGHLVGPFVTLLLAHVALGESMRPIEWAAGVCLVAGGALLLLAQERIRLSR